MRTERTSLHFSSQVPFRLFRQDSSQLYNLQGNMQKAPGELSDETGEPREWVERAQRHALQIPLRYRIAGEEDWSRGEALNLSESGILFSSESLLEINARLEITFQTSGAPMLSSSTRLAQVVRRILNNWPETRPVFGARFRS